MFHDSLTEYRIFPDNFIFLCSYNTAFWQVCAPDAAQTPRHSALPEAASRFPAVEAGETDTCQNDENDGWSLTERAAAHPAGVTGVPALLRGCGRDAPEQLRPAFSQNVRQTPPLLHH
ncbi:MAG: hypothetical protein E7022_11730 [Desulfovibrio desulfuricans]|nr:hypothetical protein [Desulfovibrio desulfuricans]